MKSRWLWPFAVLGLAACAGDISPGSEADAVELPGPGGSEVQFSDSGDHYSAEVDATGNDWVYIDLYTQTQVFPGTPESSDEWDIAFLGTDIKLNGGVSGAPPGGYEAAVYADKTDADGVYDFEAIEGAPPDSAVDYHTDAEGGLLSSSPSYAMTSHPEADGTNNPLTGAGDYGWYHDSGVLQGNEITVRANVAYVVRSVACRYFKLRMTAYARDGAPGYPQFDLLEIPGGACSRGDGGVAGPGLATFTAGSASTRAQVDASSEEDWVYLDLTTAMQVSPADPSAEADSWDIAMRRTDIKLNGGVSGTGTAALDDRFEADWDSIAAASADAEWHVDESEALAFISYPPADPEAGEGCGPGAGDYGWYYYSSFCNDGNGIHYISPRDALYLLRGKDGNYWKLRMLGYYDESGNSAQLSFEYAPVAAP